ncbi:MAG TPA: cysteine peptidase family C39 domain-containing protein [Blastocatellia bacterium]|nr:cysteine peptidase family C39 domain-containing protein [Blastocatellia bacterium]
MPLLRPPFYAQEKDSSCLAACLRMVLAAYGVVHSEGHLRDLCEWTPQRSISSTAAVAAARALGFIHTREEYDLRLHDLRDALRSGLFPIVGVDLRVYGQSGQHAQVLVSLTSRGVLINDPLMGQLTTGLLVFEQAWSESDFLTIIIE